MFNTETETIQWGGETLTLETGKIARQADGAVLARYGATSILATVVADQSPREGLDFFPLTVNYQEKAFAAGKIPGGFFKREGRPSERETLISRLIDRPIRPLFAKDFKNETQVIVTTLSYDNKNDCDIVALVAASAAIALSGVPFSGPVGAARVGYIDGAYVLNPVVDDYENSALDLVVAGTKEAVLMVESEAQQLSEEVMLGAVMYGQASFQPVIDMISRLAARAAKPMRVVPSNSDTDFTDQVRTRALGPLTEAFAERDKQVRQTRLSEIRAEIADALLDQATPDDAAALAASLKACESEIVRGAILEGRPRIDGRGVEDIRPIISEVHLLPRMHGSSLFTRGETQALAVTTLGTADDEQIIDSLHGRYRESFMLHYNFPPFSVGETGRTGFTGRREIGHGKLAWRALHPVLPEIENFPYTIRIVSEITESNGSSSMATVCASSLALMDAGVPLANPVAGIAMGLIKEGDNFAVLSDILGDEDHLGDMDFKVAGTRDGITALQMDIKINGITEEIMQKALTQAREGRNHILDEMAKVLDTARAEMGEYAPKIETIKIPVDKIRDIIGKGGVVIREISETTDTKINVNDDGDVQIASPSAESIEKAIKWIQNIVGDQNNEKITIPRDRIRDVIGRGGSVIREISEKTKTRIDIAETGVVTIAPTEVGDENAVAAAIDWIKKLTVELPSETITIPTGRIRDVIGRGGSVIRRLSNDTRTRINVGDDGSVKISGENPEDIATAIANIRTIIDTQDGSNKAGSAGGSDGAGRNAEVPVDPSKVGTTYEGEISRVMEYGIFVNFDDNKVGLVHVSQLPEGWATDIAAHAYLGDSVRVKLIGFNDAGKPRLTMVFDD